MPYASHRIVGVLELDATSLFDDSNPIETTHPLAANSNSGLIRSIAFELAESRSTPRVASEPVVKVDSASLLRELDAELAKMLAKPCSAQACY